MCTQLKTFFVLEIPFYLNEQKWGSLQEDRSICIWKLFVRENTNKKLRVEKRSRIEISSFILWWIKRYENQASNSKYACP